MGVRTKQENETETFMTKQIGRLKGYPRWEGFRDELVKILWRHSDSNEHAERIVDSIIRTRKPNDEGFVSCPAPAELIEYCKAEPTEAPPKAVAAKEDCPRCHGTGFIHSTKRTRALPGLPEREYSYSAPCSCRTATAGAA